MKRRWFVREGVFERDDSLWWLNKELNDPHEKGRTPMTIALKNGNISRVIDVKYGGLSASGKRRWIH
jgi:hypothetical protein